MLPQKKSIRIPAVAGSFYPAKKEDLDHLISTLLAKSRAIKSRGTLKILIVPHAGLVFSGQTAACGFKQIPEKGYRSVILLGVSHQSQFSHAAVYGNGSWNTPLGNTSIDENLAQKIIDENGKIINDKQPHLLEHSLEVELIFLQKILKNLKIVPILISEVNDILMEALAIKISQNLDETTLLIISSDLSHYPSWGTANLVDRETIRGIVSGKRLTFRKTVEEIIKQNYVGLDTCACGGAAIEIGLRISEIMKNYNFQEIKYENSGDVFGDKDRVVGYAAIGAWQEITGKQKLFITNEKAKIEALKIARLTLEKYLEKKEIPKITVENGSLKEQLGVFVTLKKGGSLRGCIGIFQTNQPLYRSIQEMSIASALDDPRFPAVEREELPGIKIEISVLTRPQRILDWRKIELGKHGVIIRKNGYSGTFLPQVAQETGWNREEFLSQLCQQKAGLPEDCYLNPETEIYTFEAQIINED